MSEFRYVTRGMFKTTMSRPVFDADGLDRLGSRWRALAAVSKASFFQDWGWVGCMATERYPDPILLEVERNGTLIALALFNRKPGRSVFGAWHLQESTDSALASIFVEHNGPLVCIEDPVLRQAVLADMLAHAMREPVNDVTARPRRIVLSGVGSECADAAALTGGWVDQSSVRMAPFADFTGPDSDRPFIERLSRNTRHQLRRSDRLYEADGPLMVRRAQTVAEGLQFLQEMIALHDSTWRARGKPGAFATSLARRFYQTLLTSGIPAGEVDLLQISAGQSIVGYLMNFTHGGVVSAYQSGFNYAAAGSHQKPGLTCHHVAIESYRARGFHSYDFLAGADRYKLSLANAQRWLHWLSVAPAWRIASLGSRIRRLVKV